MTSLWGTPSLVASSFSSCEHGFFPSGFWSTNQPHLSPLNQDNRHGDGTSHTSNAARLFFPGNQFFLCLLWCWSWYGDWPTISTRFFPKGVSLGVFLHRALSDPVNCKHVDEVPFYASIKLLLLLWDILIFWCHETLKKWSNSWSRADLKQIIDLVNSRIKF